MKVAMTFHRKEFMYTVHLTGGAELNLQKCVHTHVQRLRLPSPTTPPQKKTINLLFRINSPLIVGEDRDSTKNYFLTEC